MSKFPDIQLRSKLIAIQIIKLADSLPNQRKYWNVSSQLIRCSSSVAANLRASKRAKSLKDFISKLGTVEEEADETLFWLEYLKEIDSKIVIEEYYREMEEILKIIITSIKTSRNKLK